MKNFKKRKEAWACVHCSYANPNGHAYWCPHKGRRIVDCKKAFHPRFFFLNPKTLKTFSADDGRSILEDRSDKTEYILVKEVGPAME